MERNRLDAVAGALLNIGGLVVVIDYVALVADRLDVANSRHVLVDGAGRLQDPVRDRIVVGDVDGRKRGNGHGYRTERSRSDACFGQHFSTSYCRAAAS